MKLKYKIEFVKRLLLSKTLTKPIITKLIVNNSIYKSIYDYNIQQKQQKLLSEPLYINIETTNKCNANCDMCPHGIMKRDKGTMDVVIFKKLVDDIVEWNHPINVIGLNGIGEPFMDEHFFEKIEYATENGFLCNFNTNAGLMTKEISDRILNSKVNYVNISINGASQGYYSVMKLKYEKTKQNVEYLLNRKKETAAKTAITISFIHLDKNTNDIKEYTDTWNKYRNLLSRPPGILRPQNFGGVINGVNNIFKFNNRYKYSCVGLWNTINVLWNGDVSICCRDYDGQVIVGNVKTDSIKTIWEHNLEVIRRLHLESKFDQIPICKNCDVPQHEGFFVWW